MRDGSGEASAHTVAVTDYQIADLTTRQFRPSYSGNGRPRAFSLVFETVTKLMSDFLISFRSIRPDQSQMTLSFIRDWEEGNHRPEIPPSFLGLDWSTFVAHESATQHDPGHPAPPEFACYARSALDAYATAHVAAWGNPQGHGELEVTCSLKHSEYSVDDLFLEFVARFNGEPIPADQELMITLLTNFPAALKAKGIGFDGRDTCSGIVFFGSYHAGCFMTQSYPGKMIASKSPSEPNTCRRLAAGDA